MYLQTPKGPTSPTPERYLLLRAPKGSGSGPPPQKVFSEYCQTLTNYEQRVSVLTKTHLFVKTYVEMLQTYFEENCISGTRGYRNM